MSVDWSSVWEGGGRTGMERVEEERDAARAEAARLREVIERVRPVLEEVVALSREAMAALARLEGKR